MCGVINAISFWRLKNWISRADKMDREIQLSSTNLTFFYPPILHFYPPISLPFLPINLTSSYFTNFVSHHHFTDQSHLFLTLSLQIYCFDYGVEVYVWIGRTADRGARKNAMIAGRQIWDSKPRPTWGIFQRIAGGLEHSLFRVSLPTHPSSSYNVACFNCT